MRAEAQARPRLAQATLDRIKAQVAPASTIDASKIEQFSRAMLGNISNGAVPFRKACLRAVIDRVGVDDSIIGIIGDKATLEEIVAGRSTRYSESQ